MAPHCGYINAWCGFEEDSEPYRERTAIACRCERDRIERSKLSCPTLRQYGHCRQSKSCEGCQRG